MKVDSSLKKGFIYLLLAIVPIVVSVIYGQLMVSNIGHFSDYGEIVFNLGLTGIIAIPVVVTIYYIKSLEYPLKELFVFDLILYL